jgi:anti-sigma B factor antagonist
MSEAPGDSPAPPLLTISELVEQHAVLLTLAGEVDMLTAPRLESALGRALDGSAGGVQLVVVDLTGVGFLGSDGLEVLSRAAGSARERGRRVRVVAEAGQQVRRPIDLSGLGPLLGMCATITEALRG